MTHPDLLYQIALRKIPLVGDIMAKTLISYCGSAQEVLKQNKQKLLKIPGVGEGLAHSILNNSQLLFAEKELNFITNNGITAYSYLQEDYPWRLKELADSPVVLFAKGNLNLNADRMVAIVGTRRVTEHGKLFTQQLVEGLAPYNITLVSGLAIGVDYTAHRAALNTNMQNIGVLAHGIDKMYPASHSTTARQMMENGGIITDFNSGSPPDRENFPKRNRIVAGLADVLVVVETAIKGGARITAEIANSYNKDVLAVPGRVNDYYSSGCNYLIKTNKAMLMTGPEDLINLMGWQNASTHNLVQTKLFVEVNEQERPIYNYLQQKLKASIDDIAFDLQLESGNLSLTLLEMEFNGLVRSLPGKFYEII